MSASRGIGRLALPFALLSVLALAQSLRAPLGGLTALYPWPEEPRNLIANPSFESRERADVPADWTLGERWTLDSSVHHSGRTSLRLSDSHLARYTPLAIQNL